MSKNLRGYSGTQVQINLDEIIANSITATNGNFTNLTIGTYTITTLNVSDLVASGVVKFTGLTDNSSNQDLQILIRSPTDNRIYHALNFTINPQTGLITAGTLKLLGVLDLPTGSASASYKMLFLHSTGNVYKTQGLEWNEVDDVLTTPKLQLSNIVTPTTNTNYPILIIDGNEIKKVSVTDMFYNKSNQSLTAHNIIASNEIYYKSQTLDQRFEPLGGGSGGYVDLTTAQTIGGAKTFSDLLTASGNLDVGGDVDISTDLTVTGRTNLGSILSIDGLTSTSINKSYTLLLWDNTNTAGNRTVNIDAFNLFYNTQDNTLQCDKFSGDFSGDHTGQMTLTTLDDSGTTANRIPFISTGANTGLLKSNDQFLYKPSIGLLYIPRLRLTDLQDDSTSTGSNLVLFKNSNNNVVGDASFYYTPNTEMLRVENVTISNDITSTNGDFSGYVQADTVILNTGSLFNHQTNQYMGIIGQYIINLDFNIGLWSDGHIRYQTSEYGGGHRFYIRNTATNTTSQKFQIDDTIICDAELFANNGATIQAPTFSDDINCRVTFLDSNSNTGKVVSNNQLFFNPDNLTLRTPNFRVTDTAEILNLTLTGTNNATLNIDTSTNNYGLLMNSSNGYIFRMAGVGSLRIYSNTVQVYDNLQVDGSVTIDGSITKNTATLSSVGRNLNVLFHDNDANDKRFKENNTFHFNPADERLTVTNLTCSTNIKISCTVPTGGSGFPILMHNGSTSDVKKSDNTFKYDAITNVLHVKNITMDTTGEMYYKGQTLDARFGGSGSTLPINYTTVYSSRYNSSGPAWTMHNVTGQAGDDTAYSGSSTGRQFGYNNQIEWSTSNSTNGGEPKISSYGASIFGVAGAINFFNGAEVGAGDQIKIYSGGYEGWWMVHISLLYQNNSANRDMPYIRLMKQVNGTGSYIEQPQVSQGCEYIRHTLGEISNLSIHGPIYFASTNDAFRIYTLFNEESTSSPPTWNNQTTNFLGLGLNMSLTFMGNSSSNNENVTSLS